MLHVIEFNTTYTALSKKLSISIQEACSDSWMTLKSVVMAIFKSPHTTSYQWSIVTFCNISKTFSTCLWIRITRCRM